MPRLALRALAALALMLTFSAPAWAWDAFVVHGIDVEGAHRTSVGTVLNYLPVRKGDKFSEDDAQHAIRALYDTGLFDDVQLGRRDDTLVVQVKERPAIAEINIKGDTGISKDKLRKSLSNIGLDRGRTFNRAILDQVEQELRRQMYSRGKYGMQMKTKVRDLPRNRVAIDITLNQGKTARIRQVKIIGNRAFSDAKLKGLMESGIPGPLSFFSSADEYSREKLQGDLERIRSYYLDRGYAQFAVSSTQVSITPDKKDIYITINVDEGQQYHVKGVSLAGSFPVSRDVLRKEVQIHSGDLFSRKAVNETRSAISNRLAEAGYAFARINVEPKIDHKTRQVELRFFIDPGKRVYVRRITFSGQLSTRDDVYRREMRQFEGAQYSPKNVDRSKVRLQRLPQVQQVSVDTNRVPGTEDQLDVNYSITERPTGSLSIGAGYSTTDGVVLQTTVRQQNLFGSGKDLTVSLNNSRGQRKFVVRYTNPYYTDWGVSRSLDFVYRETTPSVVTNAQDYYSDNGSVGVQYGIPTSEYNTLNLGLHVTGTRIQTTDSTPDPIRNFLDLYGTQYGFLEASASFEHDTRNRTIFAQKGALNRLSSTIELPGSDLRFYKLGYEFEGYTPVTDQVVASASADIGYGKGYDNTDRLPFFQRYYAGGIRSVRGYKAGSLGPKYDNGNSEGGDLKTTGSVELIFPSPFATKSGQTRLSVFYDFGNVYSDVNQFKTSELRTSIGLSFNWRSPVGPLSFSLAKPINPRPGDRTQQFQFTIGTLF